MKQDRPQGKRGAAYVRVSHGETQNPERQRETIRAWAKLLGLTITVWYEDISGRNPRDKADQRPQFQKLIKDAGAGKLDWVVVDSQDRWGTANIHEFGHYCHILNQHDCQLWTIKGELLTSTDDASVFTSTVGAVTSTREQREKGERSLKAKRLYAKQGEWQGGYVPYGFDVACVNKDSGKEQWRAVILKMVPEQGIWHRVIIYPNGDQERVDGENRFPRKQDSEKFVLAPSVIKERVDTIREVFKLFASGAWTVRGMCQRLNQRKIDPATGVGWYHTRLKPLLQNPVYYVGATVYGKNSHGSHAEYRGGQYLVPPKVKGKAKAGRKNAEADWVFPPGGQALIDKELWDEVQARLTSTKPTIKRGLRDPRLWLSGLLVCGKCKAKMTGNSQFGLNYRCTTYTKFGKDNPTGCRLHRVTQDAVEELVGRYLDTIGPDVKALMETRNDPTALAELVKQVKVRDSEVSQISIRIWVYLNDNDDDSRIGCLSEVERDPIDMIEAYRLKFDQEREDVSAKLREKEAELERLILNMNRIPETATNALKLQRELIGRADAEVGELRGRLTPLTDQLDAAYADLERLNADLDAARKALPLEDARRKALALRKVIERVVLNFDHVETPTKDRRSKNATKVETPLETAEFVPVTGQTFTVATSPGRG